MIVRSSFPVPRSRSLAGFVASTALLLAVVPAASAAEAPSPPSGAPSVSQYTEVIPTSGGGTAVGGKKKEPGTVLPEKTRRAVQAQGGSDAGTLEKITTSPAYGAPATPLPQRTPVAKSGEKDAEADPATGEEAQPKPKPKPKPKPESEPEPDSSEAVAPTDNGSGGTPTIALVVGALLLGTAGAAALALRRRNSLAQHRV